MSVSPLSTKHLPHTFPHLQVHAHWAAIPSSAFLFGAAHLRLLTPAHTSPHLSRFMPTWAAIPSSAFLFGAAHLSPKDFPVLFALGCLLGALYVRSRNLLTPMLVHGAWNSAVLTLLFLLVSSGIDIQELLGQLDK